MIVIAVLGQGDIFTKVANMHKIHKRFLIGAFKFYWYIFLETLYSFASISFGGVYWS